MKTDVRNADESNWLPFIFISICDVLLVLLRKWSGEALWKKKKTQNKRWPAFVGGKWTLPGQTNHTYHQNKTWYVIILTFHWNLLILQLSDRPHTHIIRQPQVRLVKNCASFGIIWYTSTYYGTKQKRNEEFKGTAKTQTTFRTALCLLPQGQNCWIKTGKNENGNTKNNLSTQFTQKNGTTYIYIIHSQKIWHYYQHT